VFGSGSISKESDHVNKKPYLMIDILMFELDGFDPQYRWPVLRKRGAITTIETIKGESVFITDPIGCIDR